MDELVKVDFPGGKRVDARLGLTFIPTDQRPENGGEGSAPAPFQLFLASIATCAGILALNFCEARRNDNRKLTHFDSRKLTHPGLCS
jgi:ribosomal protein S12 methylthiotransferase accessory factor